MLLQLLAPGVGMGGSAAALPPVVIVPGGTFHEPRRGLLFREQTRGQVFCEPRRRLLFRVVEAEGETVMLDILSKRDNEDPQYTFDFSRLDDFKAGAAVAAVVRVWAELLEGYGLPVITGVLPGTDGKSVTAVVAGGVGGSKYLLKALVLTTAGRQRQCNGVLEITDN